MTDDHDWRVTGLFVGRNEQTPAFRLGAEDRKEVCRSHRQLNAFRLIFGSEIGRTREDCGQVLKHCVLRTPVEKVGWSYLPALALCVQFLNGDDPIGLRRKADGAAILY